MAASFTPNSMRMIIILILRLFYILFSASPLFSTKPRCRGGGQIWGIQEWVRPLYRIWAKGRSCP